MHARPAAPAVLCLLCCSARVGGQPELHGMVIWGLGGLGGGLLGGVVVA